jgi:hypothetical protein
MLGLTYDKPDKSVILLGNDGSLSVLNDVDEYVFDEPGRIVSVIAALRSTGATSGQTTIDVKKAPRGPGAFTSILATALSIAFNAAAGNKWAASWGSVPQFGKGLATAGGEPSGVVCAPGDILRLDVTAIPGTASAGLSVYVKVVNTQV